MNSKRGTSQDVSNHKCPLPVRDYPLNSEAFIAECEKQDARIKDGWVIRLHGIDLVGLREL